MAIGRPARRRVPAPAVLAVAALALAACRTVAIAPDPAGPGPSGPPPLEVRLDEGDTLAQGAFAGAILGALLGVLTVGCAPGETPAAEGEGADCAIAGDAALGSAAGALALQTRGGTFPVVRESADGESGFVVDDALLGLAPPVLTPEGGRLALFVDGAPRDLLPTRVHGVGEACVLLSIHEADRPARVHAAFMLHEDRLGFLGRTFDTLAPGAGEEAVFREVVRRAGMACPQAWRRGGRLSAWAGGDPVRVAGGGPAPRVLAQRAGGAAEEGGSWFDRLMGLLYPITEVRRVALNSRPPGALVEAAGAVKPYRTDRVDSFAPSEMASLYIVFEEERRYCLFDPSRARRLDDRLLFDCALSSARPLR